MGGSEHGFGRPTPSASVPSRVSEVGSEARAVGVEHCCCASPRCRDFWLTGAGKFVQGSGFTQADAEHIAALLNAYPLPSAGE